MDEAEVTRIANKAMKEIKDLRQQIKQLKARQTELIGEVNKYAAQASSFEVKLDDANNTIGLQKNTILNYSMALDAANRMLERERHTVNFLTAYRPPVQPMTARDLSSK